VHFLAQLQLSPAQTKIATLHSHLLGIALDSFLFTPSPQALEFVSFAGPNVEFHF